MKKITTIINYCTNDYIFLKSCIDNARPFSHEIIIPYCDHFHDGTEENKALQEKSVLENTGVQFVEFAYDNTKSSRWHCNISRKIGIELASTDTEFQRSKQEDIFPAALVDIICEVAVKQQFIGPIIG